MNCSRRRRWTAEAVARPWTLAVGLLAALPWAARADGPEPAWPLQSRVMLRAEAYSGTRLLDRAGPVAALSLWTDGRLRLPLGQGVWSAHLQAQGGGRAVPRGRVRELYWRAVLGGVDLRAGRLMPSWGRADGWNPTDTLTPRDLRLLTPEMEDQRFGRNGVQADLALPAAAGRFSVLALRGRAATRYPLRPPAGVALHDEGRPAQPTWAAKWDVSRPGVDASLSYVLGTDLTPDLRLAGAGGQGVVLAQRHHRQRVLGADVSLQHQGLVWRGEAAWSRPVRAEGDSGFDTKRDAVWLVAGPEWSGGAVTVGAQLVWQRVQGWRDPGSLADPLQREAAWAQASLANQAAPRQGGLTLRVAHRALNEALQAELAVLALWPQGGLASSSAQGLARGKLAYALDDQWAVQFGFDWPFGPPRSFFGPWAQNRLAHAQLRRAL